MADDIWAEFRQNKDETTPSTAKKKEDPWAEFRTSPPLSDKTKALDEQLTNLETPSDKKYPKEYAPMPKFVEDYLGKPENSPNPLTMTKQIGKGIPVVKKFIPQDEDMTRMEKEWPKTTALARGTGAVGATLPFSMGMGALTGPALLPAAGGQALVGAGLAGADTLAEKGRDTTGQDLKESMGPAALWGAAGPIAGKLLSPGTYVSSLAPAAAKNPEPWVRPTWDSIRARSQMAARRAAGEPDQMTELMKNERRMAEQVHRIKQEAAKNTAREATQTRLEGLRNIASHHNDSVQGIMTRMLLAGGPMAYFGHHPIATGMAATGAAIAPHVPALAAKYAHNTFFREKTTRDVLNALFASQGGQ